MSDNLIKVEILMRGDGWKYGKIYGMKTERERGGIVTWHGTDRTDFTSFDTSCVVPYNVGLHFDTRAAALACLAYLREHTCPRRVASLFKCHLDIRHPFRIVGVLEHYYVGIFTALEGEFVSSKVLMRICDALKCDIGDIIKLQKHGNEERMASNCL